MRYKFFEPLREFKPGDFPIWVRRRSGGLCSLYWTPFTVVCAACKKRHSCKCPMPEPNRYQTRFYVADPSKSPGERQVPPVDDEWMFGGW